VEYRPVTTRELADVAAPRRRWRDRAFVALVLAVLASPALLLLNWTDERSAPVTVATPSSGNSATTKPAIDVIAVTRQLKLVTVRIDSIVRTTSTDPRWNGTASATLEAKVAYSYGVDLSDLPASALRPIPSGGYVIVIPPPQRLSTEVDTSHPVNEVVSATGMRFKRFSGQQQLTAAHKTIYDRAKSQPLPPQTMTLVRQQTAEQVQMLLGNLLADGRTIIVRFSDD